VADLTTSPANISKFMQAYSKQYAAGAFATPLTKELTALSAEDLLVDVDGHDTTVIVAKTLSRPSRRKDFTGREYILPVGSRIVQHMARSSEAPIPDLSPYDYVYAYIEDRKLKAGLERQGFALCAINISASSEIISCWRSPGLRQQTLEYCKADEVTVGRITMPGLDTQINAMRGEVMALRGWNDDYPYYSDGSWSALSLRGFYPEDATLGVKPSEMPRAWQATHPEAMERRCDWTVLTQRCPITTSFIQSVKWWRNIERIRFMRMQGRDGKGGVLSRHSDITDRSAGTSDGQIARFHMALSTHPDIRMRAWSHLGAVIDSHLAVGECWYLDQRKPHAVNNPTRIDRIHLVVDVIVDADVRREIEAVT
jgi:hypothetical protein